MRGWPGRGRTDRSDGGVGCDRRSAGRAPSGVDSTRGWSDGEGGVAPFDRRGVTVLSPARVGRGGRPFGRRAGRVEREVACETRAIWESSGDDVWPFPSPRSECPTPARAVSTPSPRSRINRPPMPRRATAARTRGARWAAAGMASSCPAAGESVVPESCVLYRKSAGFVLRDRRSELIKSRTRRSAEVTRRCTEEGVQQRSPPRTSASPPRTSVSRFTSLKPRASARLGPVATSGGVAGTSCASYRKSARIEGGRSWRSCSKARHGGTQRPHGGSRRRSILSPFLRVPPRNLRAPPCPALHHPTPRPHRSPPPRRNERRPRPNEE